MREGPPYHGRPTQHRGVNSHHYAGPEPVNGTARPQSPHSTRPTASGRRLPTPRRAKAGERRSRPAKGGDAGPAVVGWRTIGSANSGRARDPAAGAEAPRRDRFFALERRDTRQCREPISARLNAAAGRSAVPHPGRRRRPGLPRPLPDRRPCGPWSTWPPGWHRYPSQRRRGPSPCFQLGTAALVLRADQRQER